MTTNDDQLVERLVPKILSSIRAKAKAVESIDIKADLEGITSIPCYDTSNGIYKQVLVSIESLKEPAQSASDEAKNAAIIAIKAANEANEFANKIVVCTEAEYIAMRENGTLDDTKLYFTYEEEE